MADSKISALPAVTTLADTDVLAIVNTGASMKVNLTQLTAYFEQRGRQSNSSVAAQGPGLAADTYVVGSDVPIPTGRLQVRSMYRVQLQVTKTAAGTAIPIVQVRVGTLGTTGDTSMGTLTLGAGAGSAVADEAFIEVYASFRTNGTAASVQCAASLTKNALTTTGFISSPTGVAKSVGTANTTTATKIGLSYNGGTSASHTINLVQAELFNLV